MCLKFMFHVSYPKGNCIVSWYVWKWARMRSAKQTSLFNSSKIRVHFQTPTIHSLYNPRFNAFGFFLCLSITGMKVHADNYILCNLLYYIFFLGFGVFFHVWWQTDGLHSDGLHHIWRLQDYNRQWGGEVGNQCLSYIWHHRLQVSHKLTSSITILQFLAPIFMGIQCVHSHFLYFFWWGSNKLTGIKLTIFMFEVVHAKLEDNVGVLSIMFSSL